MPSHSRNRAHSNNHILGRIGLVIGLLGSFGMVLMPAERALATFTAAALLAIVGYTVYVIFGN